MATGHHTRTQYLNWRGNQFSRRRPRRSLGLQCSHFADQFHSVCHVAECGEALAVGVALASEIQFRLIAYAYEEGPGSSGAYHATRNR